PYPRSGPLWLVLGFFLLIAGPASAQPAAFPSLSSAPTSEAAPPPALAAEDVETLGRVLDNPQARAALLDALRRSADPATAPSDAAPVPAPAEPTVISDIANHLAATWTSLLSGLRVFESVPQIRAWLAQQTASGQKAAWLTFLWQATLALGAGIAAGWLIHMLIERPKRRIDLAAEGLPPIGRWLLIPLRLLLTMLPVAALAVGVNLALPLIEATLPVRLVAGLAINTFVAARLVHHTAAIVLTPPTPALALVRFTPESGAYLYIWIRRMTNLAALGVFVVGTLEVLGLPVGTRELTAKLFGLVMLGLAVVLILQSRKTVAATIRLRILGLGKGSRTAKALGRLAEVWHVLALVYVCALFLTWLLDIPGGFHFATIATVETLLAIAGAGLAMRLSARLLERLFAISEDLQRRHPGLHLRANRYLSGLKTVVKGIITLVAVVLVLQAWGADSIAWVTGPGSRLIGAVTSIAFILVAGLVTWEVVVNATERYLSNIDANGHAIERSQRARTLIPLARTVIMIFLVVVVSLIVLSELGMNIGPLLAGAGVLGLAISFGAQKLVQDVITGAFCLIDDAISVGDVVEVAGLSGVVERLSIRSIRLRDLAGSVHTIPFSTVNTVTNLTKDFSFYVMTIGVAYREDTDAVCALLTEIDEALRAKPEYAAEILEPIEILGVDSFGDSAVNIKARIKTRPIKQWFVGREFNRMMKQAFDAAGIEIPFPHTTVYFGADRQGAAPPAHLKIEGTLAPERPGDGVSLAKVRPADAQQSSGRQ
ncbi:mechanosensitive ion channel protein MscS, partial [Rhodospirillum rubrum]